MNSVQCLGFTLFCQEISKDYTRTIKFEEAENEFPAISSRDGVGVAKKIETEEGCVKFIFESSSAKKIPYTIERTAGFFKLEAYGFTKFAMINKDDITIVFSLPKY